MVWHSVMRTYVDPSEWQQVEQLTARLGVWRLSYEPDTSRSAHGVPLRVHGLGTHPDGDVLARGGGHGPPLTLSPC